MLVLRQKDWGQRNYPGQARTSPDRMIREFHEFRPSGATGQEKQVRIRGNMWNDPHRRPGPFVRIGLDCLGLVRIGEGCWRNPCDLTEDEDCRFGIGTSLRSGDEEENRQMKIADWRIENGGEDEEEHDMTPLPLPLN